jgi:hypothetical protein
MGALLQDVLADGTVGRNIKKSHPFGAGVKYLHRNPGSLKSETVKYGHESQDRTVLSSERAPQKNKTITVKE